MRVIHPSGGVRAGTTGAWGAPSPLRLFAPGERTYLESQILRAFLRLSRPAPRSTATLQ